jgi:Lysylphosphatidylglycerol synthase TM region
VGAMALSIRGLPEGDRQLVWWAILVTGLVGIPVLIVLSGVEYTASAAVLGHRVRLRDSLPIALYARAANLLPIPGAALVRMQALKRAGSSYGRAASATMATALFWMAGALLVGGGVLAAYRPLIALGFVAAGCVTVGMAHVAVRSIVTRREDAAPGEALRRSALLLVVEVSMVVIRGVLFWFVMIGFDIGGSFQGAMVLPVAVVLASAIGFFPAGLGVREVISAGLAGMVGDTASSGALASGLDRLVSLPVMAVIALALAITGHRLLPDAQVEEAEPEPEPATDTA